MGRVVILNGSSSAGKSTLAAALQQRLADEGECWAVFSWDDFVPRLPERWCGGPDQTGDRADEGCRYTVVGPEEALLHVGPVGVNMLRGYHRAIAALAKAGNDVIVEEVLITPDEWDDWGKALDGIDTTWVAVRCDTETVVRREHERGDRYPALARGTANVVHQHVTRYDLEVDTTMKQADELAAELARRLMVR